MRIVLVALVLAAGAGACSKNKKPAPATPAVQNVETSPGGAPPTGGAASEASDDAGAPRGAPPSPDSADPCEGGE